MQEEEDLELRPRRSLWAGDSFDSERDDDNKDGIRVDPDFDEEDHQSNNE